ncbi:MAG: ABC-F family ATP-binding cassette domain-containing protein [Akkermansiaceae bacterium]|nr:ABC-F family ATP-binding cassette domain-containing protein [Akkermansiaceae bacterium]
MVFAVQDLHIEFGPRVLFDSLSFVVERGERIAFAGQNGAGKSTLMKCIVGVMQPDRGQVLLPKHTQVGYLPQDGIHISGQSLLDEVLGSVGNIVQLQQMVDALSLELQTLDSAGDAYRETLEKIGHAELLLQERNAATLRPRAESILRGLGFSADDFGRDCGEFSGGWQMRIALAKLLLQEPEVLLLDEPTNHLDIQSQRWLEQSLRSYRGAICIISHDVALLDSMVTRTIAFHHGRAEEYSGNFSFYLKESKARKEILLRQAKAQQREIAKTQAFIDRFRAKATKASQAQSRIKQLEKIELIEVEDDDAVMSFRFPPPPPGGSTVVRLDKVSKAYGPICLLKDYDFTMEKGDRIAIVGVNGSGKSTFTRIVSGTEAPDAGLFSFGHHTQVAFFSQTHADVLNNEQTVLECVEAAAGRETRPLVRNLLGCFLFRGDDVFKKIGVLSGGERSRVALVCMLLKPANFLIMDEPTNHLDFQSQDVLQRALEEYPGSYCIVSHNRQFLDPIVNKVLEFRPGYAPRLFYGNVTQYLETVEAEERRVVQDSAPAPGAAPVNIAPQNKKEARRVRALEREKRTKVLKPLQKALAEVEDSIALKDSRREEISTALEDPANMSDNQVLMSLTAEYQQLERETESLYTQWEDITTQIEQAEADLAAEFGSIAD